MQACSKFYIHFDFEYNNARFLQFFLKITIFSLFSPKFSNVSVAAASCAHTRHPRRAERRRVADFFNGALVVKWCGGVTTSSSSTTTATTTPATSTTIDCARVATVAYIRVWEKVLCSARIVSLNFSVSAFKCRDKTGGADRAAARQQRHGVRGQKTEREIYIYSIAGLENSENFFGFSRWNLDVYDFPLFNLNQNCLF